MALRKIKIGDVVEPVSIKCGIPNLTINDVSGINRDKEFFEPSKQVGEDTTNYKIVPPGCFACNLMHVGRDIVLPIAVNRSNKNKIVSPAYNVFKLINEDLILSDYFSLFLKSSEKDRFFWFHTDSSIRDGMDWDVFCNVQIEVPSIDIQRKYIKIYQSLRHNLEAYKINHDELKKTYDMIVDKLKNNENKIELGRIVKINNESNLNLNYGLEDVKGVSSEKIIIPTKADAHNNDLSKFTIVQPGDFVYNPRNGVAVAVNNTGSPFIISWNNTSFRIKDEYKEKFDPNYIHVFLCRKEWDRKVRFLSWGSSTEVFSFKSMSKTEIPVIPLKEQKCIVNLFRCRRERIDMSLQIKQIIEESSSILISGSIKEAKGDESYAK